MRPSIARLSDMPGPKVYSNWWGYKGGAGVRSRGQVEYTLSPFQSKAAPKMFRTYLFNGYRRLSGEFLYWVIPFSMGYGVYSWAKSYDHYHNSKAGHIEAMKRGEHH